MYGYLTVNSVRNVKKQIYWQNGWSDTSWTLNRSKFLYFYEKFGLLSCNRGVKYTVFRNSFNGLMCRIKGVDTSCLWYIEYINKILSLPYYCYFTTRVSIRNVFTTRKTGYNLRVIVNKIVVVVVVAHLVKTVFFI